MASEATGVDLLDVNRLSKPRRSEFGELALIWFPRPSGGGAALRRRRLDFVVLILANALRLLSPYKPSESYEPYKHAQGVSIRPCDTMPQTPTKDGTFAWSALNIET
eukprot:m.137397 g.137397  ORF g.137397 m.137397 type:complete len:107 (-) comp16054_c1_seq2:30-350(-)